MCPLPLFPTIDAHMLVHADTHRHTHPCTMASEGPRGHPGAQWVERRPAWARAQALGLKAPRPTAQLPGNQLLGGLCWGCSPPSGALGKRLPATQLINPLGK